MDAACVRSTCVRRRAKACAGFRETIFKEGTYRDTKIADRGRDDGIIYIDYYLKEVHPLFFILQLRVE